MSFDPEEIKRNTDIVAVVGSYVGLKRRGREFVGLCLFHDDHDPSMWVIPEKRLIHCFSCGWSGDVIKFIEEIDGVGFQEACRTLGGEEKRDWKPKPIEQEAKRQPDRITAKPPPEAGRPDLKLRGLGEPVATFDLRDADGALLAIEARYESAGKKTPLIWSWGKRGKQPWGWGLGHPNTPRPLYGLDRLSAHPDKPVIVTEGPKKADAAAKLLTGMVGISWTGGANAWHKHEWEPLRGRAVTIWPDADEAGRAAADKLADHLSAHEGLACKVKIIDTDGMPEAWDVADALEEGWSTDRVLDWAKPRLRPYSAPEAPQASPEPIPEPAPEPPKRPQRRRGRDRLKAVPTGSSELTEAETDAEAEEIEPLSDDDLAQHLIGRYGENWRYVAVRNKWYEYRGDGWHEDQTRKIRELCVRVGRQSLTWQKARGKSEAERRKINSKRTAGEVRELVAVDQRVAATVEQWDADPLMLGTPEGVLDLRTGKMIEAAREQYITKRTLCAPRRMPTPVWDKFLQDITQGDPDLLSYLQRLAGYCLTGETREEMLAFVYGPAAAGKSKFIETIATILGDYYRTARLDQFTETKHESHAEKWAVLAGARMVSVTEIEEGRRWREATIKAITGRDKIRCNYMAENSFEYRPQFKILISGNHIPHLRSVDEAMRRRMHIIPFKHQIPPEERDQFLPDKLRDEYPGILQWALEGCLAWQDAGLGRPEVITQASEAYLQSEDALGDFLSEFTTRSPEARAQPSDLYAAYKQFCEANGEFCPSMKRFAVALRERGFDGMRSGGKRWISGLALNEPRRPSYQPHAD